MTRQLTFYDYENYDNIDDDEFLQLAVLAQESEDEAFLRKLKEYLTAQINSLPGVNLDHDVVSRKDVIQIINDL